MIKDDGKSRHYSLYILRCEEGKYYVGVTSQTPERRMQQHIDGRTGAYWTEQYKPTSVIYTEDLGVCMYKSAQRRENKMVRACIKKYGLNNVRGGDLTDTGDYVRRFGYFRSKDDWEDIKAAVGLMLIIVIFAILYYLK